MHSPGLPPAMEPAELVWRDGVPESTRFGDVYFSRDNGLAETRYVFIGHNQLPERFQQVPDAGHFVIAETGFGTGLNFLAAWAEWLKWRSADDSAILHFVSVERFPLRRQGLEKALSYWPELTPLAAELIEQYPPLIKGTHRLVLAGGRVRLTLYFGDVLDAWKDLTFTADAWFLDGFAPSLNPDMWLDEAIGLITRHSKPGTTLATFTAVGRVRRSLAEAGFEIAKVPGFGRKREMLAGVYPPETAPGQKTRTGTVAVIGAGIAGALLARNLAERGVQVLLLDQAPRAGSAASGNPQGALYVKLGVEYNAQTELAATALSFSQRFYRPWQNCFWHPTGLLQLATGDHEADRQRRFCERNDYPDDLLEPVDASRASKLAGISVNTGGLWFPGSGWLEPAKACEHLVEHPLIETRFSYQVANLLPCNNQWCIRNHSGEDSRADAVVIAGGHESPALVPVGGQLRLKAIRGQVTELPEADFNLPQAVICGTKYVNPVHGGRAVTGATFDLKDGTRHPTRAGHQENLDELQRSLPSVVKGLLPDPDQLQGRVAFRCTTHDYQPVAGTMLDTEGNKLNGLYLLTGLGSKGLAWAPLLAEYLADVISGEPRCLPAPLAKRLETGRLYRA
ncbi:bifunctional tRNA (5-methylaminomethyl-2-thiouridine)(34)-methyltransferase MnmD/FAD-dependent 5-carboxymethylaminomethyl-2-thiouridine(34) oxidoreductase MnmC [Marinobacter sp. LQ44]|uniref:bifunctional tRNA (5-methylaminomethyl-2-thiouridine)(34)-methyltransferase MnmD/FAD-dependent 5-carboxymethylaminomethyl-2-thiouridine(34) oxidoreductase MnmC n=1 Tax=unclassified Marinobacter TaxID=83889 RepID=UPI000718D619|nr:bifunctional tRNA (5-methylaminomethyl-2-thiouridine)(34)-methyltransferase MnmD/FAD-dependent 5-carboxymethylaminomethyl-2-thiouridine(34) oxidoreductase MnmC [Marinobacter sp. LQ44]AMQ87578.1 FAD-dependent cmnm(5)s(2)U34 oxidoreductase [Marinobacter sp. LQ44]